MRAYSLKQNGHSTPTIGIGMSHMDSMTVWIPGEPATFATEREASWKQVIAKAVPAAPISHQARGLILDFSASSLKRRGHPFDVDNLCDPMFSVIVNNKGWFHHRRPNIRWWKAGLSLSERPGCRVTFCQGGAPEFGPFPSAIMNGSFSGQLPRSSDDVEFCKWLTSSIKEPSPRTADLAVRIGFQSEKVNIGEIATGRVKNILDCLYPILGGKAGRPEDWRIRILQVEKGYAQNGTVNVSMARASG